MKLIDLHRQAGRAAFFGPGRADGLFFDAGVGAWIAATPADCEAVLRSRDLDVSPYGDHYRALAMRDPTLRFPNIEFAFDHLPMCLSADSHKAARQRTASYMASARPRLTAAIPEMVERHLAPIDRAGPVDLMAEFVRPLVLEFVGLVIGIDTSEPALGVISPIFDRMIGLRRRRLIEDGIAAVRAQIRRAAPDISPEDEGVRLTLVIVGVDSLAGTLADSLQAIFTENEGRRLDQIDYPAAPVATGVPFVERTATVDAEVAGATVAKGERVRVMLQAFQYSGVERDRLSLFGLGAHTCVGRQISLDLWAALCARLARIARTVRVTSVTYRSDDYVFAHPDALKVELGA